MEVTVEAENHRGAPTNDLADMTLLLASASWYMGAEPPPRSGSSCRSSGGIGLHKKVRDGVAAAGDSGFDLG